MIPMACNLLRVCVGLLVGCSEIVAGSVVADFVVVVLGNVVSLVDADGSLGTLCFGMAVGCSFASGYFAVFGYSPGIDFAADSGYCQRS